MSVSPVDAQNVLVGSPDQLVTGAILSAPIGVDLPESPLTEPDAAFTGSGYVSAEGLTLTPERSTNSIRDWSGSVVREILTEFNGTLSWQHLETNEESLKTYFGDDQVEVTGATEVSGRQIRAALGGHELPRKSWLFRMKDGDNRILIVVPDGQITDQGEVTFTKSDAIIWPVTLSTYPDEAGNNLYIFTDDGVFTASEEG